MWFFFTVWISIRQISIHYLSSHTRLVDCAHRTALSWRWPWLLRASSPFSPKAWPQRRAQSDENTITKGLAFTLTAAQSDAVTPAIPTDAEVIKDTAGGLTYDETTGVVENTSATGNRDLIFLNPMSSNDGILQLQLDVALLKI
jgi:hypothetical protein